MDTCEASGRVARGLVGTVAGYGVLVVGDAVLVGRGGERLASRAGEGLGRLLSARSPR